MKLRSRASHRIYGYLLLASIAMLPAPSARAQQGYQKPPKAVLDILNAPQTPNASVNPSMDFVVLYRQVPYPSIADMAQPMLRLAGLRINPLQGGTHNPPHFTDFVLRHLPDGAEHKVALPQAGHFGAPTWAPDGKHFIVTEATENATLLWVADTTGAAHSIAGLKLNAVLTGGFGGANAPCEWMGNSRTLLCRTIPAGRGAPPAEPKVPLGPHIEESMGRATPAPTFEDLLQNSHDEDLFDFYARSQLEIVDLATGRATQVGTPALFAMANPAPDGEHILVERIHRQNGHYSFLLPDNEFPRTIEVWDRSGHAVYKVADQPLADTVPVGGVQTGPRSITWRPTDPATLVWVEALDGGNTRKKGTSPRDKVMWLKSPFTGQPEQIAQTEQRYGGLSWGERGDFAILRDSSRATHHSRAFLIHPDTPGQAPQLLWDLDTDERYNNPGTPITRMLANGHLAIRENDGSIFLEGAGASPQGDRPFVDRFNLGTLQAERIFQCPDKTYEIAVALIKPDGSEILTRHETPDDPPNYFIRTASTSQVRHFTNYSDPTPQLRSIHKELVKYKRPDGVDLSMEIYLPLDYKQGQRYPAAFWAYPREVANAAAAGEITGSPYRFTTIRGYSELFFLLDGYVVMEDVSAMPVVGDPETVNNTYVDQIVADAKAAINKAADMGVVDPNRVGVGGHSYGAFMTANLLAHSDVFKAGIAESGAYNRTLTPFGFQNEERTFWQAQQIYLNMSPFLFADKIKAPILLIHGEADNNSGTFPIQSERMYRAIKGNGGIVRYVTLPLEAHGYAARETIEHVVWEKLRWFDLYVKNPGAATSTTSGGSLQ